MLQKYARSTLEVLYFILSILTSLPRNMLNQSVAIPVVSAASPILDAAGTPLPHENIPCRPPSIIEAKLQTRSCPASSDCSITQLYVEGLSLLCEKGVRCENNSSSFGKEPLPILCMLYSLQYPRGSQMSRPTLTERVALRKKGVMPWEANTRAIIETLSAH